jgi:hypothetical protein
MTSNIDRSLRLPVSYWLEDANTAAVLCIAAGSIGYFIYLWVFSGAAWLHPELLGTAVYIWNKPETDTFAELLRKVFDCLTTSLKLSMRSRAHI